MDSPITDFASLVDLFSKLANRPAADDNTTTDLEDLRNISVPPELQNVVRNLSSLIAPRTTTSIKPATTRPRRNTVAVSNISPLNVERNVTEVPLPNPFPIEGQRFPFTFKMMLHKLYELDDWEKKVKDILSQSQSQFKPLASIPEQPTRPATEKASSTPKVHFATGLGHPKRRSPSSATTSRNRSVSLGSEIAKLPLKETKTVLHDDTRAVKKRCVGRRKSFQEASDSENGARRHVPGLWVYESAVASVDNTSRDSYRRRHLSGVSVTEACSIWKTASVKTGALLSPSTPTRSRRSKTVSDARGGLVF